MSSHFKGEYEHLFKRYWKNKHLKSEGIENHFKYLQVTEKYENDYVENLLNMIHIIYESKENRVTSLLDNLYIKSEKLISIFLEQQTLSEDLVVSFFVKVRCFMEELIYQSYIFNSQGEGRSTKRIHNLIKSVYVHREENPEMVLGNEWYKSKDKKISTFKDLYKFCSLNPWIKNKDKKIYEKLYSISSSIIHSSSTKHINSDEIIELLFYTRQSIGTLYIAYFGYWICSLKEYGGENSVKDWHTKSLDILEQILPKNISPNLLISEETMTKFKDGSKKVIISKVSYSNKDKNLIDITLKKSDEFKNWYYELFVK